MYLSLWRCSPFTDARSPKCIYKQPLLDRNISDQCDVAIYERWKNRPWLWLVHTRSARQSQGPVTMAHTRLESDAVLCVTDIAAFRKQTPKTDSICGVRPLSSSSVTPSEVSVYNLRSMFSLVLYLMVMDVYLCVCDGYYTLWDGRIADVTSYLIRGRRHNSVRP